MTFSRHFFHVIPAKAGIHRGSGNGNMDPRVREDDRGYVRFLNKTILYSLFCILYFVFPHFASALGCCQIHTNGAGQFSMGSDRCETSKPVCDETAGGTRSGGVSVGWGDYNTCSNATTCLSSEENAGVIGARTQATEEIEDKINVTFRPEVSIPFSDTIVRGKDIPVDGLTIARYVKSVYDFFIAIAGFTAVVFVMIGGFQWATSNGNQKEVADAKSKISRSLLGIMALFSTYQLLNVLGNNLAEFRSLGITAVVAIPLDIADTAKNEAAIEGDIGGDGAGKADAEGWCAGSKPFKIENGFSYEVRAEQPYASGNYFSPAEINVIAKAVVGTGAPFEGKKLLINSAMRKYDQQATLRKCWLAYKTTNQCIEDCAVCQKSEAAAPNCLRSPHLAGFALDLNVAGTVLDGAANQGIDFAAEKYAKPIYDLQKALDGIGYSHYCGEWWHFQKNGTPGSLCAPGCHKKNGVEICKTF